MARIMWPFKNAASTGLVLKPDTNAVALPLPPPSPAVRRDESAAADMAR